MLTDEKLKRLCAHDWRATIKAGTDAAHDKMRKGTRIDGTHIAWELLRDAVSVSRIAYTAPPRSGYPQKSALSDGVDEVTAWQLVSAYLKGEIENLPSAETKAPRPTAQQITRAEVMLELWHHVALMEKGDRERLKRAIYLKASGMRPRAVKDRTGLNYQQLWNAQKQACADIWEKILQLSKLGG